MRLFLSALLMLLALACSKEEEEPINQVQYSTEICEYIHIVPNPADDIMIISLGFPDSTETTFTISIYDARNQLMGEHIFDESYGMASVTFDVTALEVGRYRFQILWSEKECNQFVEVI